MSGQNRPENLGALGIIYDIESGPNRIIGVICVGYLAAEQANRPRN